MRRILFVIPVLAVALMLWWPRPQRLRLSWQRDHRYRYRLSWSASDHVKLPMGGQSADSELVLDGELALRSYGEQGGVFLLGMTLAPTSGSWRAFGRDLDLASLAGHEAIVKMAPTGEVSGVVLAPGDPELWKLLATSLAGELAMSLPAEPRRSWNADADDNLGTAHLEYRLNGDIERRRTHYSRLISADAATAHVDSHGRIALEAGQVRSLDEKQTVIAGDRLEHRATLALSLLRVEAVAPAAVELGHEERLPGRPLLGADVQRQLLQQRVGDMTSARLMNDLYTHLGGGLHDNHQWFLQASGLLIREPALCGELLQAFTDEDMGHETRQLILDLLVAAGHPEAQAALRGALSSPAARGDHQYGVWLQRLGMVGAPDAETMRYLTAASATADRDLRRAGLFALGAAAGKLSDRASYAQILEEAHRAAQTPEDRAAALRAMGNAGIAGRTVVAEAHDPDLGVRAAAAAALRKLDDGEARAALFDLAADSSTAVSAEALSALEGRRFDDDAWQKLQALVGRVPDDAALANLVSHDLEDPRARNLLVALLHQTHDVRLQARLRTLLGEQSSPL